MAEKSCGHCLHQPVCASRRSIVKVIVDLARPEGHGRTLDKFYVALAEECGHYEERVSDG